MTVYYVRSTDGNNADNGSTWALAKATLAGALAVAAAGDTIYVSQVHAEAVAGVTTLTSPGTAANPVKIICGNDAAQPPTALATTAVVSNTGDNAFNFGAGFAYCYGIEFKRNSNDNQSITFSSTSAYGWTLERCKLNLATNHASGRILMGSTGDVSTQRITLIDTTVAFGNAAQNIMINCPLIWKGNLSSITGTIPTTTLFAPNTTAAQMRGGFVEINGVDLSAVSSGALFTVTRSAYMRVLLANCKINASVALTTGSYAAPGSMEVTAINCDSGNTNYKYTASNYLGTVSHDVANYRNSGATDGTTPISYKMASTANTTLNTPLVSPPITIWNDSTSSKTITVEVITDNVTLTDADAWVEVEYLGSASTPISTFVSDRVASNIATAANQTTSSATWTSPGITTDTPQQLAVTFTPARKGPISIRVYLARASTNMWFCPRVDSRTIQWVLPNNSMINDGATADYPAASHVDSTITYARGTLTGTLTFPAGSNVLSSVGSFGVGGTGSTATLTLPTASNVLSSNGAFGVGGTGSTPTLTLPTASKVHTSNGAFGVGGTGSTPTLTLPDGSDVYFEVGTFGIGGTSETALLTLPDPTYVYTANGNFGVAGVNSTPTLTLPDPANVLAGSGTYGIDGTGSEPTLTIDYPDVGNVLETDTVDGAPGTLTLPPADKVLVSNGVYGPGGNSITPTWLDTNLVVGVVNSGVQFGVASAAVQATATIQINSYPPESSVVLSVENDLGAVYKYFCDDDGNAPNAGFSVGGETTTTAATAIKDYINGILGDNFSANSIANVVTVTMLASDGTHSTQNAGDTGVSVTQFGDAGTCTITVSSVPTTLKNITLEAIDGGGSIGTFGFTVGRNVDIGFGGDINAMMDNMGAISSRMTTTSGDPDSGTVTLTITAAGTAGNSTLNASSYGQISITQFSGGTDSVYPTGTLVLPSTSHVLTGSGLYGVGGNGSTPSYSPDFPSVGNVLTTDTVNGASGTYVAPDRTYYLTIGPGFGAGGTISGTATIPAEADVLNEVVYGVDGEGSTGTLLPGGSEDYPDPQYVLTGHTTNGEDGTLTLPGESSVANGVVFGVGGDGSTGTMTSVGDGQGIGLEPDAENVFLNADQFAEPVIYKPRGSVEADWRTILAVVDRNPISAYPGDQSPARPGFFAIIAIANDGTKGITTDELDTGGDVIRMPRREGGTPEDRTIERIVSQDAGMITLEVR